MTAWRKSSYSGGGGGTTDCVELAGLTEVVGIRDSKDPEAGHLTIGRSELAALLEDIKAGKHEL